MEDWKLRVPRADAAPFAMIESNREFSKEFQLALVCARWPLSAADKEEIRTRAKPGLDWNQCFRIFDRNQMIPLAYRNLCDASADLVGTERLETLKQRVLALTSQSLSQAAELYRIAEHARKAGVNIIALKGVILSILAYGGIALRSPGDIDLLTEADKVLELEAILSKLGYIRYEPKASLTPRRLKHYLKYYKHFAYVSESKAIALEVHWRLFHNNHLTEPVLEPSKTIQVPVGAGMVSTLSRSELFLYLCVHGTIHGWPVLKWLADIGALLRAMTEDDLRAIVSLAAERGLTSQLRATMLLVDSFIAVDHPAIEFPQTNDAVVRRIVSMARRLLTANDYCLAIEDFPRFGMFMYDIGIGPSWRYRGEDILRAMFFPDDWETLDLPDSLFPLYAVVRPVSWMMRQLSRVPRRLLGANHRPLPS